MAGAADPHLHRCHRERAAEASGAAQAAAVRERSVYYHWFRSRGRFTGSGVVESGCKSVIGQRLKLSGMHWTAADADAITTLRYQRAGSPKTRSGMHRATRRQPPDQPNPLNDLDHLQN